MARFGDAELVLLCDFEQERAAQAARRVNELAHRDVARAAKLDVRDEAAVVKTLTGIHAVLSAVPYTFNLALTRAAIQAGCHFCDLGGNTDIVLQQWGLDAEAKKKNVS